MGEPVRPPILKRRLGIFSQRDRGIGRSASVKDRERIFCFGGPKQKMSPSRRARDRLSSKFRALITGGSANPKILISHGCRSPDLFVKNQGLGPSCGQG